MPNVLNQRTLNEFKAFLAEAEDSVVVDITGQSVHQAHAMRTRLRKNAIQVRVLKTSLARIAAKDLGFNGGEKVFTGASALVWGGESVADVARALRDLAREQKDAFKVRGGFLGKQAIGKPQVAVLADLPTREQLLSQIAATLVSPLSGFLGALNGMLNAVPALTQSLQDKGGGGGGTAG